MSTELTYYKLQAEFGYWLSFRQLVKFHQIWPHPEPKTAFLMGEGEGVVLTRMGDEILGLEFTLGFKNRSQLWLGFWFSAAAAAAATALAAGRREGIGGRQNHQPWVKSADD